VQPLPSKHISLDRLRPFMKETYNDPEKAVQLYVWDRKLSTAFFYDISILDRSHSETQLIMHSAHNMGQTGILAQFVSMSERLTY